MEGGGDSGRVRWRRGAAERELGGRVQRKCNRSFQIEPPVSQNTLLKSGAHPSTPLKDETWEITLTEGRKRGGTLWTHGSVMTLPILGAGWSKDRV